jgi:hypothetical protein
MAANYKRQGVILLLLVLVLFYVYYVNNVLLAATAQQGTTSFNLQKATVYADLKLLAYSQMTENAKKGLPLSILPMEHYSISKFQLSPGHAAGFSFEFKNAAIPSKLLNNDQHTDNDIENENDPCVEKIICRIHKGNLNNHFPHFAQDAFPCFSAFQQAMRIVKLDHIKSNNSTSNGRREREREREREVKIKFILQLVIPKNEKMNHFNKTNWNADLIKAFGQTGIEVSTVQMSEDGTILGKKWNKSAIDDGDCDWIASLVYDTGTSGWAARKDQVDPRDGEIRSRWPIENAKYFSTQK